MSIYRRGGEGDAPPELGGPQGEKLAVWQTGYGGIDWMDSLVKQGDMIELGGNGYPYEYTAKASILVPAIVPSPPEASEVWACGPYDIITPGWEGKTTINREALERCLPDEWLIIEVWDES